MGEHATPERADYVRPSSTFRARGAHIARSIIRRRRSTLAHAIDGNGLAWAYVRAFTASDVTGNASERLSSSDNEVPIGTSYA